MEGKDSQGEEGGNWDDTGCPCFAATDRCRSIHPCRTQLRATQRFDALVNHGTQAQEHLSQSHNYLFCFVLSSLTDCPYFSIRGGGSTCGEVSLEIRTTRSTCHLAGAFRFSAASNLQPWKKALISAAFKSTLVSCSSTERRVSSTCVFHFLYQFLILFVGAPDLVKSPGVSRSGATSATSRSSQPRGQCGTCGMHQRDTLGPWIVTSKCKRRNGGAVSTGSGSTAQEICEMICDLFPPAASPPTLLSPHLLNTFTGRHTEGESAHVCGCHLGQTARRAECHPG